MTLNICMLCISLIASFHFNVKPSLPLTSILVHPHVVYGFVLYKGKNKTSEMYEFCPEIVYRSV